MARRITTLAGLKALISNSQTPLFVRWSRGYALDARSGVSRDYVSGSEHDGLSAVAIDPDWATDDVWMARRVTEYWFLQSKDRRIGCHIYSGKIVGQDSDGYESISDVSHIATLAPALIESLLAIKWEAI